MDRDALLEVIRERNVAYRTCRSVTEENQALTHEVDYLREQLHRLEHGALLASTQGGQRRPGGSSADMQDEGGTLCNDALKLSPLLWPRLAFGAVRRLSPSDSAEFCCAVEAVCATAKDWNPAGPAADGDDRAHTMDASSGGGQHSSQDPLPKSAASAATKLTTLEDVVNEFCTNIVRNMLAQEGKVDLGRVHAHEDSFRRILVEVCYQHAASPLGVSKDLAEQDRKRANSMPPNQRTLMSEELIETHQKLASAEQAMFASQAELLDAYRKLAASGKEVALLRKKLVAVQGDLFKANKELNDEVAFFHQVQEENRVQAVIIKSHGPQVQELRNEIRQLKDQRTALQRKVWDLEDLVLMMQQGEVAQARCLASVSKLAVTAADRVWVVMDKRRRETSSLESLLTLAVSAPPLSPSEPGAHAAEQYAFHEQHVFHDCLDSDTPKDDEEDAGGTGSGLTGLVLTNVGARGMAGMQGWAQEALQEAAADLRRIVHDVDLELVSEAQRLETMMLDLEPHLARHVALLQERQAAHLPAAATLARVLADQDSRHQRMSNLELEAHNAAMSDNVQWKASTPTPALQRRPNRSISLGCESTPKTPSLPTGTDAKASPFDRKGSASATPARLDSNGGGIGMSFSTGSDGCFYVTGLRPGSPAALCGLLQVRTPTTLRFDLRFSAPDLTALVP